jgi:hypothetical protein
MTKPICRITHQTDHFLRIEIEFIEGTKGNYRKKLEKNATLLESVIKHYCNIWIFNENNLSSLHGDLSLGNVILNSHGIHIIDWEHFKFNVAPWGFDALYLLFETLWFSMSHGKRKEPSKTEIKIIVDNMRLLMSHKRLEKTMIEQPLRFIINFCDDKSKYWGVYPKKIPLFLFGDSQIALIDEMIQTCLLNNQSK